VTESTRIDRSVLTAASHYLRRIGTEVLSDVLQRLGSTNYQLRGIRRLTTSGAAGLHVAGPAFTIQRGPANGAHAPAADVRQGLPSLVASAQPGDVIVLSAYQTEEAVWGDYVTKLAKERDLAGVIVDGAVRNSVGVAEVGFPVFARGVNFYSSRQVIMSHQTAVCVGGAIVRADDIVVADEDGALVVAAELCPSIVEDVERELVGRL
jgi:regulator of RNase E activity RraA